MEISYVCIYVENFAESVASYRDVVGLEEDLEGSSSSFHAFRAGPIYIGIEPNGVKKLGEKTRAENPILIQFKMKTLQELEEFTKRLESRNVKILNRLKKSSYGTLTNFIDLEGNKLEALYQ